MSAEPVAQLRQQNRLRAMADFYLTTMRTQIQTQFQYRAATYMYLVGMVAEPVIYLVVWTTIAEQHGGSVQGISTGEFAAYYIVWTLVRNMNIVFTSRRSSATSPRPSCSAASACRLSGPRSAGPWSGCASAPP